MGVIAIMGGAAISRNPWNHILLVWLSVVFVVRKSPSLRWDHDVVPAMIHNIENVLNSFNNQAEFGLKVDDGFGV